MSLDDSERMMARIREGLTWVPAHWDRSDMRFCLGWAFDELERLRAGGCARDQKTTQYCAEAATLANELERVKVALANAISQRDKAREALRPFAFYAEQRARQPFRGLDDAIHTIHIGTEYEADIRLSHCVAAQKALGQ